MTLKQLSTPWPTKRPDQPMQCDRERWNKKYRHGAEFGPPSPLVTSYHHLAPGRRVLDIAAGDGRNALYLAEKGFLVFAVEIADKAIDRLHRLDNPLIVPIQADMDNFPLRYMTYDLIINCRFLDRRIFPYIQEGLSEDGLLIFESALENQQPGITQPENRDFLLRANNELLHCFLSLHIHLYQETIQNDYPNKSKISLASLVAQKKRPIF